MSNDFVVIVVVEDDPDDQYLIQKALASVDLSLEIRFISNGFEAIGFFEGTEAKSEAGKTLAFIDLNLPGASGFEVLKAIKSDPVYQSLPVVILTTSNFDDEKQTAVALGANEYIVKPDNIGRFEEELSRVIHEYMSSEDTE